MLLLTSLGNAQRGKHGSKTISGTEVINEYTSLSADATSGTNTITVVSNTLNANGRFSGALTSGDLILIIQIQGASINGQLHPTFGDVCDPNNPTWGSINSINNCGNWEYLEVSGTTGGSTINLRCGIEHNYTSSGKVQVIRVPRYTDININGTLTADDWVGVTGGIVAFEVDGNTTINGSIDVSNLGFRGGSVAGNNGSLDFNSNWFAGTTQDKGGEKGESVVGDWLTYQLIGGRFAKGAIGNGGGGGSSHNAGGAGGANASDGINTWTGLGVPNFITASYATAWAQEGIVVGTQSSGGGRGGYSWSANSINPLTVGPGDVSWGGDNRRSIGGFGGRDLDYSTGKMFFGGGGGGGHENNNQGGDGGDGGGMIFISSYGTITGTGSILANGENGQSSNYTSAGFGQVTNKDGSGGAGAGGAVYVTSPSTIAGITITANGGSGGNQVLDFGSFASSNEAQGPGGGGGGGYIKTTGISSATNVNGGIYGTTNSSTMSSFPPNGATSGALGLVESAVFGGSSLAVFNDTICAGNSGLLTATGTPEVGSTITWYNDSWTQVGTGLSLSVGVLFSDAMYFYGSCPGTDFDTVWVIVSPAIVIDDTGIIISDETCIGNDGSITGILVSGGIGSYNFLYNGSNASGADTLGAIAGNYTLEVSDAGGCSDTSGPYTIGSSSGLIIDISSLVITDESCAGNDGNITGIIVSGGSAPYSYAWNGTTGSGLDTIGAAAGVYTLMITDQFGCSVTSAPFTIGSSTGLSIDLSGLSVIDANCLASDGSISGVIVSGGTLPYSYTWNGLVASSEDTVGIGSGNYTLEITDNAGCNISAGPFTVSSLNTLVVDSIGFVTVDENCTAVDGSISGIAVSGGSGTYSFAWNGVTSSGPDTVGLGAGAYTLIVSDDNGCADTTGAYLINSLNSLSIDTIGFVATDENCTASDGSITGISVSGGSGVYSYAWNGVVSSSPDTVGLGAGSYTLVVTDNNGCADSTGSYILGSVNNMIIDSTSYIISDANCSASDGGVSGIVVSGPGLSYTYSWNGTVSPSIDLINATSGSYMLIITDDNGCVDSTGTYFVNSISTLNVDTTALVVMAENCTAADGSIVGITVSGGTAPYLYDWNGVSTLGSDTIGLDSGSYILTVTDDAGCSEVLGPFLIPSVSSLFTDDSGILVLDAHCGLSDGAISGIIATGSGTLNYSWNGLVSSGTDTSNLVAGNYLLTVTDANGCVDSLGAYTVSNISGPVIDSSAVVITDDACSQGIGGITGLAINGGSGPVSIAWDNTDTVLDLSGLYAGNYSITVIDSVGCVDSLGPIVIIDSGNPTANFTASPIITDVNNPLINFTDASSSDVTTWNWYFDSLGTDISTNPTFSFNESGVYQVVLVVLNSFGCTDTASMEITVNAVDSMTIPNIMTPDGNGINDVFSIAGLLPDSYVAVYNRWGQKIFETTRYLNNWDGRTSTGERVPNGTYFYVVVDPNGVEFTGSLSVSGQ